jgi:hypothetical protein
MDNSPINKSTLLFHAISNIVYFIVIIYYLNYIEDEKCNCIITSYHNNLIKISKLALLINLLLISIIYIKIEYSDIIIFFSHISLIYLYIYIYRYCIHLENTNCVCGTKNLHLIHYSLKTITEYTIVQFLIMLYIDFQT